MQIYNLYSDYAIKMIYVIYLRTYIIYIIYNLLYTCGEVCTSGSYVHYSVKKLKSVIILVLSY